MFFLHNKVPRRHLEHSLASFLLYAVVYLCVSFVRSHLVSRSLSLYLSTLDAL